jgi:hypothetical protein
MCAYTGADKLEGVLLCCVNGVRQMMQGNDAGNKDRETQAYRCQAV